MSIDVQSLANQSFRAKKGGVDLEVFAALVLEEAAKVCDYRIATNLGDDVRNFEAQIIAEWIHAMKPGQL